MKIAEALLISDLPEAHPPELRKEAAATIRALAGATDYSPGAQAVTGQVAALMRQNDKLQKFKDLVHVRLTEYGVPEDPYPEENAQHGCRISCRLKWLVQRRQEDIQKQLIQIRDVWLGKHTVIERPISGGGLTVVFVPGGPTNNLVCLWTGGAPLAEPIPVIWVGADDMPYVRVPMPTPPLIIHYPHDRRHPAGNDAPTSWVNDEGVGLLVINEPSIKVVMPLDGFSKQPAETEKKPRYFAISGNSRPRVFITREDLLKFCGHVAAQQRSDWIPVQEIL